MDRNIGTWKVPERGAIAGYEALERKLVPTRGRHNFPLSGDESAAMLPRFASDCGTEKLRKK